MKQAAADFCNGLYSGIPLCCVLYFCKHVYAGIFAIADHARETRGSNSIGYVQCDKCFHNKHHVEIKLNGWIRFNGTWPFIRIAGR